MAYSLNSFGGVVRDADGALLSTDPANPDRQAYQAWVDVGNAPTPAPVLPRAATAKQIRYALNSLGVRAAWNAAVTASSQDAQDYWTSADPMVEDNGKVVKWCTAAGTTPKALFDLAVTQ